MDRKSKMQLVEDCLNYYGMEYLIKEIDRSSMMLVVLHGYTTIYGTSVHHDGVDGLFEEFLNDYVNGDFEICYEVIMDNRGTKTFIRADSKEELRIKLDIVGGC